MGIDLMMKPEGDTGMNGDSDIQFIDMWGPFLIKMTLMKEHVLYHYSLNIIQTLLPITV